MTIKLVVLDLDRCVFEGRGRPIDFEVLSALRKFNRDGDLPPITACSIRPQPYVEFFLQAIDGTSPAGFEEGAAIYSPETYRCSVLPGIDIRGYNAISALKEKLATRPDIDHRIYVQPGRDFSVLAYPQPGIGLDDVKKEIQHDISLLPGGRFLHVRMSPRYVLVKPAKVSKAQGCRRIAEMMGIDLANVLSMGDDQSDAEMLMISGYSGVPSNAEPSLKESADFCATEPYGRGICQILERCRREGRF